MAKCAELREAEGGRLILARLTIASTFAERAIGLLARRPLEQDEGLWLEPCSGVHTIGMRYPIDVLFLSRTHEIIRVADSLKPWRSYGPVRGARIVIELSAGAASSHRLATGLRLEVVPQG